MRLLDQIDHLGHRMEDMERQYHQWTLGGVKRIAKKKFDDPRCDRFYVSAEDLEENYVTIT